MKANAVVERQGDSIYLPLGFFRHIIYRIYKDFLVSHKDHKGFFDFSILRFFDSSIVFAHCFNFSI